MKHPAVVTGGASGIGLAVVRRLLDDGWPVAIVDRDGAALGHAETAFSGEDVMVLEADVSDEEAVDDVFDAAVERMGLIGGLVNCAGIAVAAPAEETGVEMFRHILDVNLIGSFIACRAALRRMGASLAIVNVSSVSGLRASSGRLAYGASKAGVKLMSEVLAVEYGNRAVRVNCVAPGPIESPLIASLHGEAERRAYLDRIPQARCGEAGEVAAAIAFLLSPEAAYINGHTLAVDGGFVAAGVVQR